MAKAIAGARASALKETTATAGAQDNAKYIWNWLKNAGASDAGAAALLSNWKVESNLDPYNWENTYNTSLGKSDAEIIAQMDSKNTRQELLDAGLWVQGGVGLAQWTYLPRKEGLFNYAKSKGTSIGDMDTQLEYAKQELEQYGLWDTLANATDPYATAWEISSKYEMPGGEDWVHEAHSAAANDFYTDFTGQDFSSVTPLGYASDNRTYESNSRSNSGSNLNGQFSATSTPKAYGGLAVQNDFSWANRSIPQAPALGLGFYSRDNIR